MARKVRRVRRRKIDQAVAETPAQPTISEEEAFRQEYAYVLKDLRRVFILAVAMFLLLIALNLILR